MNSLCSFVGGVELRCNPVDEAETYVTLHGSMPQFWPEVKRATCPVAILAGSHSPDAQREVIAGILKETAAQLPTAVFDRSGLSALCCFCSPLLSCKSTLSEVQPYFDALVHTCMWALVKCKSNVS